jgi:hypothetical protein
MINKYWVSIWNLEKVDANTEEEAVKRLTEEFYAGWYSADDFEYDDIVIWDGELDVPIVKQWEDYKVGKLQEWVDIPCDDKKDEGSDKFLVMTINCCVVEAEDEDKAREVAREMFYYLDRTDFEIHVNS